MPSRNIIKMYITNGYYHLYNRGVDKRKIFIDQQDCNMFLYYLKLYLMPIDELKALATSNIKLLRFIPLNLSSEVDLLTFTLMPNHFHLQIKQRSKDGVTKLSRRLLTSYAVYFNKKYKRVGPLFQSRYKAACIETDAYLLQLSRYIHLNPMKISSDINFIDFSSYPYFLGNKNASWIKPEEILHYFKNSQSKDKKDILSYQSFVEDSLLDSNEILGSLTLEEE